jgi:hypothetical protein
MGSNGLTAPCECKFSMRTGSWFIGGRGQNPNKLGANLTAAHDFPRMQALDSANRIFLEKKMRITDATRCFSYRYMLTNRNEGRTAAKVGRNVPGESVDTSVPRGAHGALGAPGAMRGRDSRPDSWRLFFHR